MHNICVLYVRYVSLYVRACVVDSLEMLGDRLSLRLYRLRYGFPFVTWVVVITGRGSFIDLYVLKRLIEVEHYITKSIWDCLGAGYLRNLMVGPDSSY